jgi:flagellar protein FliS
MLAAHRYARNQTETASPERLLVLLFEAALRNMRAGAEALEAGRHGDANGALTRATDIVVELLSTLDARRAPALCAQLGEIYCFVSSRLIRGNAARDAAAVREAERAFAPVAEAFSTAVAAAAVSSPRAEPGALP